MACPGFLDLWGGVSLLRNISGVTGYKVQWRWTGHDKQDLQESKQWILFSVYQRLRSRANGLGL